MIYVNGLSSKVICSGSKVPLSPVISIELIETLTTVPSILISVPAVYFVSVAEIVFVLESI